MRLALLLCLLCGLGGGCMREVEVIACREPSDIREIRAPGTTTYTLWQRRDGEGNEHVVFSAQLSKGDALGFESAGDGQIIAVAGPERRSFPAGVYRWVRPPNAGDRAGVTALLVAAPFMVPL